MNEEHAKGQLKVMHEHFTTGSILHLLADLYRDSAKDSQEVGDTQSYERLKTTEQALFVVGLGIDAVNPAN